MSNSGPNLQECRKKGLLEKDISFLSLSPPFFFVSRADAGENTREIETWDCSKNKKIRAKPDSRIQCLWRLLLMGSWHRLKFLETCGAACSRLSDFPRFSPRFPRVGFTSLLTYHERLEQATCGHLRRVWRFFFSKTKQRKAKKGKKLTQLVYKPVPPCMAHTLVELELRCRRFWSNWLAHIPCFPPKEVCKPKYEGL